MTWDDATARPLSAAASTLTPREQAVVAAALANDRQTDAAAAARVSLRTFQRIAARPQVAAAIQAETMQRLRRMSVALGRHAERAAETLGRMANGELPPTLPRVAACRAVCEFAMRALEVEHIEARLAEIEGAISNAPAQLPPWADVTRGEPS